MSAAGGGVDGVPDYALRVSVRSRRSTGQLFDLVAPYI